MAWMPVAEAAASLGVSERTIWRRIKSDTIPSKSDRGRTLVALDDPDPDADPVRQMSHVAAAQLSMRKLDADTLSEVLAVMTDYRTSFDDEIRRVRRGARFAGVVATVLLLALCGGVWYHMDKLGRLDRDRADALNDAALQHESAIASVREEAARAEGLAGGRAGEIETLRNAQADYRTRADSAESSREQLQASIAKEVTGIREAMSGHQQQLDQRDAQIAQLTKEADGLRKELTHETKVHYTVRRQLEKAGEAARRSAARQAGALAGLKRYVDTQHAELTRLRHDLADARLALGLPDSLPTAAPANRSREAILQSVINPSQGQPGVSEPDWLDTLRSWFTAWITGPIDEADATSDLAQAD